MHADEFTTRAPAWACSTAMPPATSTNTRKIRLRDDAGFREVATYTVKAITGRLDMVRRPCLPMIHKSVFDRIRRGTNYYAPQVIREGEYEIAWNDSGPYMQPTETTHDARRLRATG